MYDVNEIKNYLKNNLVESRFNHTLGVVETSIKLAKINDVDLNKAKIAALIHDVAKNKTVDEMKKIIDENKIKLSYDEENTPELWHSIIAPIIGREVFNIDDEEILSAVRWHTTGKENMSTLDKIVYIADMIEPNRRFPGVEKIRSTAFKNLDEGILMALTHTTRYLLDKGFTIDINSIKARNYLLLNK
ncbi:bis(5'-nucleosyl)-tetraphosphatase (symmetrical) YqeK [Clostridium septicum]|uniref:bis(5'-nucleosyl)-tetraphosphatase (symmetrical) n=1 Tax=Clostridium septicum TaxID=1504 RepID=A0A9N7PJN7_CLOSE|nr:bis(5'-nucleosyl)-tetraphosphatase (symmetrical) YqeK [Clostridium septicum]AYE34830.1 phosphohydrolase [Clostridium septicum]MDU1313354.1 bis(5'-nucleosyl)-tetraphosphatase (symmetrical) YqeK [Clostridium septicum]QAS60225.1 HD domain-containing protein [Clostridium septicum]UEC20521.1 bis(5'-nucleosyl)-tetraphosphatase (symmetrical) YqeK [Clostridium septicum]USS01424.1 bis(5'-nucleosyl)-tetraphosphatase (symmetrical) YqeK [Clostridium septicum]